MNKRIWVLAAAALAGLFIMSCNGGDDGGGGTRPPVPVTLDVEPGTWTVVGQVTPQTSGCLQFQDMTQTRVFCDGVDLAQQTKSLGLDCTFTVNGSQVQGTCSGTLTGSVTYSGAVAGAVGAGGRSVTVGGTVDVMFGEGPEAGVCRYAVVIDGTWKSPDGCGTAAAGE